MSEHPPPAPQTRVALVVIVALSFLALLAGAVAFAVADDGAPAHDSTRSTDDVPELGLGHVHGLGVDPADGTLYAAGHYGVFRLPDGGEPSRVADRYQDTMGFAVTGPNTFLGSGHPDLSEGLPSRLGLIESTDAGQTWTPLSLSGEADFHTLHAAHGRIYGYDSTSETFMISADRREWDRRSSLPLRNFVVHPAEPGTILASGEEGLIRSRDGGRSWRTIAAAPELVVLAWKTTESLYGVAADGTVHHSADSGSSWAERDDAGGVPEALTVVMRDGDEVLYAAIGERGIVQSDDGGRTFTVRYAAPPAS